MMRIDLESPLGTNQKVSFFVEWSYKINDATIEGRSGYEYFPADKNYLYEIAQWFPRMCVFDDVNGWQHKSYIGRGEFALEFGDYRVTITVPNDHVVAATGTLMNPSQVLKPVWQERLKQAANSDKPVFIITKEEAIANETSTPTGKKTWIFEAKNVRDFAFASSRKFLWDAASVTIGGKKILAQSFYPKEGMPLWDKYSTHAIMTTLQVYSRYTFDYPYPTAISVHGPVWGMEYPMICFNGGRPNPDGTYSRQLKYALISVIIHEVGHNYFPMIVSSDERQWSWLDEGLNSFLQFLTEQEFEPGYPSRRGFPQKIVPYMAGGGQEPIMTNSESINQFGNNAYGKPATALNILRETVLGRELFDYAFKEYANRWKFKHPEPADFFRTMEDASGVDLDWFWRGWFYSTDPVDISIDNIIHFKLTNQDPVLESQARKDEDLKANLTISKLRNDSLIQTYYVSDKPELLDFYNQSDEYKPADEIISKFRKYAENLPPAQQEALRSGMNFYTLQFSNKGIIMPLIFEVTFTDGSKELFRLPAEVWTKDNTKFNKEIVTKKEIASVLLDPYLETADIDTENNLFPRKVKPNRFELFKSGLTK
ncbi:MAG: M1 family metallopeptidase [Bacteroidia bacterium]|nr:M1 family metallopeptidase [Bacteroidia bacterium]